MCDRTVSVGSGCGARALTQADSAIAGTNKLANPAITRDRGKRVGSGDIEMAARLQIVDLEPNAATRSATVIGQLAVFGPQSWSSERRPAPRACRERGGVPHGSRAVDAARIH